MVFIPTVGEFVIPDLLGGSATIMLGQALWTEFFSNRDWTMASALAVLLTALLLAPALWLQRLELGGRSEEHTSELQSLMRISYAVFCLKKKIKPRHLH